ncbi:hypothetical protein C8J56DRAFT_942161, partial [Mycena floridula]
TNPQLINTSKEFAARSGESALYLSVMSNLMTGVAPKKSVRYRESEALHSDILTEGWMRPNVSITGDSLNRLTVPIMQASEWSPNITQTPSVALTVDTQGDVVVF